MDALHSKKLISTKEASDLSSYSADHLARLARAGEIESVRVGRTWLIERKSLIEFLKKQGRPEKKLEGLIPTKVAAQLSGYTTDYLAKIARDGEVEGVQVGRTWLIKRESLESFLKDQTERKEARARELARAREIEYRARQDAVRPVIRVVTAEAPRAPKRMPVRVPALQVFAVLALVLIAGTAAKADVAGMLARGAQNAVERAATAHEASVSRIAPRMAALSAPALIRPDLSLGQLALSVSTAPKHAEGSELASRGRASLEALPSAVSSIAASLTPQAIASSIVNGYVRFVYGLAAAGPASARFAVVSLGESGDALLYAAAVAPHAAAHTFLAAAALPSRVAPAIASRVFDNEYAAAERFVAFTSSVQSSVIALADSGYSAAQKLDSAPHALWNASLAAVGTSAVALSGFEQAALSTYYALHRVVAGIMSRPFVAGSDVGSQLSVVSNPPEVAMAEPGTIAWSGSAPVAAAPAPAPRVPSNTRTTVNTYPSYTTVVRGLSLADLDASLASLKSDLIATMSAMVGPVAAQTITNITTIQQVNRIQDLSDLIVRNGDFRGGTMTGATIRDAISISATAATFSTLTLSSGTISGDLNIAGALSGATIDASGRIRAPYFVASSTAATSTFAGSVAVGGTNFVVDRDTGYSGFGTSTPSALLSVSGNGYITGGLGVGSLNTGAGSIVATATTTALNFAVSDFGNAAAPAYTFAGNTAAGLWSPGANQLALSTSGTERVRIDDAGRFGIGTQAPAYELDVTGVGRFTSQVDASHFVATSTTATSTFAGGLTVGSSNFVVDRATGYGGFGTTTPSAQLAVAGNTYITGGLGVGVATSTPGVLETSGNARIGGNLTVVGNSTTLGASSADSLIVNSAIKSHLVPDQNIQYDLGSNAFYWRNLYVGNITANSITANGTNIGGTNAASLTLNADNATNDAEDSVLNFFRGNVVPNALLTWNSTADRFEFNQPLYIQNGSASTTIVTMDIKGVLGQTADLFRVESSAGSTYFNVAGDGSATFSGALTVSGTATLSNLSLTNATTTSVYTSTLGLNSSYFTSLTGTGLANTGGALSLTGQALALHNLGTNGLIARTAAGTVAARTITGTADRISITNGDGVAGNPTVDVAATYAGQTSITTLGAITSGTWNGSTIGVAYGGTGATTLTGLVQGNGTSAMTAVTTSAGIASNLSDETGSGALVFASSPTLVTPNIGAATGSSLNLGSGAITSGLINGQTISSAANFTGTLTAAGSVYSNTQFRVYSDGADTLAAAGFYLANSGNTRAWNLQPSASGDFAVFGYDGASWAEKMRITTAGNVGIGTTTPQALLHVFAPSGTAQSARFSGNGATGGYVTFGDAQSSDVTRGFVGYGGTLFGTNDNTIFGLRSQGALTFATNGGTRQMTIDTSGNVGIGTTGPVAADASSKTLQLLNTVVLQNVVGTQALFSNNAYFDNAWKLITAAGAEAIRMNADSGQPGISFHVAASGLAGAALSTWDTTDIKMRINQNGNVGIGTASPNEKLEVAGNERVVGQTRYFTSGADAGGSTGIIGNPNGWTRLDPNGNRFIITPSAAQVAAGTNVLDIEDTSWNHKMELHADGGAFFMGKVGVGDGTPTNTLDVGGTIGISDTTVIDASRNLVNIGTISSGAITSGLINGQTISSAANFTGTLAVAGVVNTSAAYQIGGVNRLDYTGGYTTIKDGAGRVGVYVGSTDPGNYFDNTTHYFRSVNAVTTFATINSSGVTANVGAFNGSGSGLTGTASSLTAGAANSVTFNGGLTTGSSPTFAGLSVSTINGGTPITSSNIGSQSVNYATSAGSATVLSSSGGHDVPIGRTFSSSGLTHYSSYGYANRPPGLTYTYNLQVTNGNQGFEIAADWISAAGPVFAARSIRDCCQDWSSWVRLLDSNNNPYAYNMNQYVRTSDGPSFAGLSLSGALRSNSAGSGDIWLPYSDGNTYLRSPINYVTQTIRAENGNWSINNSGVFTAGSSISAPIFYDSNNTSYYVDPNSQSYVSQFQVAGGSLLANWAGYPAGIQQTNGAYMYPGFVTGQGSGWNTSYYLAGSTSWGLYSNTSLNAQGLYDQGNRVCSSSWCRINILYDSDNTNYYVDPNGTSVMSTTLVSNGDSSYTRYGPNTTWGGYLYTGAMTSAIASGYAQVISTNGNLHLDSGTLQNTYINYYSQRDTYINAQGGNVGIGTAGPGAKLEVANGRLRINQSDGAGQAGVLELYNGTNLSYVYENASGDLYLTTGNTSRYVAMQTGGGSVGIGTGAPGQKLEVAGNIYANNTGGNIYAYYDLCIVGPTAQCLSSVSDQRFKKDIATMPSVLDALSRLRPVTYRWNDTYYETHPMLAGRDTGEKLGFIAQEVLPLFPQTVAQGDNGYYSINYDEFVPVLTEAVQELNARTSWMQVASSTGATTTPVLTLDASTGNIGIGTATPNHTLDVAGDIAAISFVNTSTRTMKTDISYADATTTSDMLAKLMNLKVATYRYTIEDQNDPLRLGLIAEDTQTIAPEVLSVDGKGVDIYKLATFTLAGVQALADKVADHETRIASLEARMTALESGAVGMATSSTLSLASSTIIDALANFKNVLHIGKLAASVFYAAQGFIDHLTAGDVTVGTPTMPSGVTLYDAATKQPYCFSIVNGSPATTPGACGAATGSVNPFGAATTTAASTASGPLTITLLGDTPTYLNVGAAYAELGAVVSGGKDGTAPYEIYVNGTLVASTSPAIDTSVPATYIITYSATDSAGETTTAYRSVIVGNPDGGAGTTTTTTTDTSTSTTTVSTTDTTALDSTATTTSSSSETSTTTATTTATSTTP